MSKGRLPVLIEAVRTMRGPPAGDVDRKPHVVAAGELHPVAVSVLGDSFDFSLEIGRELNYRHRRFPPLSAIRFQPPLTRLNHATTSRCFSNFAPFGQTIITLVLPPSLTRWALGSFTFSMVPSGQRTRKWPFNGGSLRAAMGFLIAAQSSAARAVLPLPSTIGFDIRRSPSLSPSSYFASPQSRPS